MIKTKADCREMLKRIEDDLLVVIPRAIRHCKTDETMYGLLVCYLDLTPADEEYTPHLHLLPKSHRDVRYIWVLPEIETFGPVTAPKTARVNKRCNAVYRYLTDGYSDQDEFELLIPFRKMIYRVCRQLNAWDWTKILPVTDDFTVVASDWSTGAHIKDDAKASVPAAQQRKLSKKGFFFNQDPQT